MTVAVLPPGGAPPAAARRAVILAVCCTSLFLTGFDTTAVMIGLPAVARSLHAGVSGLQWSVTAYTVTLASLLLSAGALADRLGRRMVFQSGLAVFVLGSWLCSIAPDLGCLIAFRAVQGAGASAMNPAALGIITSVYSEPASRARAIGIWDGVLGLSMALGPVTGGILVSAAGWRGIFWANIPAGLAALSLTSIAVPESRVGRPPRPDPAAQALVMITVAALATAIIQVPDWGWRAPPVTGLAAVAALGLAGLVAWERSRADPLIRLGVCCSVRFTSAAVTAVCAVAAMAGFLFLTTLYLQDVRGMPVLRAALTLAPMPAEMAVCAPLAGRIIARHGPAIPALAAGAGIAASSIILAGLTPDSSPGFLALTYSLFGLGAGCASPVITSGIMSAIPAGKAGLASGLNSSVRQLGQCLGVAVVGSVLAGRLRGQVAAGFLKGAHPGWWILAGCGLAVLTAGVVTAAARPSRAARSRQPRPARPAGLHTAPRALRPAGGHHAWSRRRPGRHARPARALAVIGRASTPPRHPRPAG
jgi:EmrB/QacA subfamily drug resistance transporter